MGYGKKQKNDNMGETFTEFKSGEHTFKWQIITVTGTEQNIPVLLH
jgi:hypothetical protein